MIRRIMRHKNIIPVTPPENEEIHKAWAVLNQQMLSVYQPLLREGLTTAGENAKPFAVRRSFDHSLSIEIVCTDYPRFSFRVQTREQIMKVVEKTELIFSAIESGNVEPIHRDACCPLATFRKCVCRVSFDCPLHGSRCHGTHD